MSIVYRVSLCISLLFAAGALCIPETIMGIFTNDAEVIAAGCLYLRIIGWVYPLYALGNNTIMMLRAVGVVRISLVVYSVSFVVNGFLNWVFIFGNLGAPRMEIQGAALATAIARVTEFAIVGWFLFKREDRVCLRAADLLTFTGRSDASSKFAKHNRVGYFPSGAIAWRISEEPFLQDVAWIDELKLRASIGKTGTQNISDHMFRTLYAAGAYAGVSALYPEQLGNDAIKWESTVQKDLGLDFSFFQGRLSGTLAYYYKTTDGALLNITPPPSTMISGETVQIALTHICARYAASSSQAG